jgi:hypothetical protein
LLQAISKLALRAQTVEIANLPLRQDLFAKNVLMTAQRNFCLGNTPLRSGPNLSSKRARSGKQQIKLNLDDLVKSHHIDGKVKSSYARHANLEE